MEAIVAVYSDWGIGDGGTQPVVLKADRVHFREITTGHAVIVGRRTMSDFPGGKPLKNRYNIVVSRQNVEIDGAEVVHSVDEALEAASKHERTLVIGGASVYKQFYPYLTKIHLTKIALAPHSDSFFPNLDEDGSWKCTECSDWMDEDGLKYCFCTYER